MSHLLKHPLFTLKHSFYTNHQVNNQHTRYLLLKILISLIINLQCTNTPAINSQAFLSNYFPTHALKKSRRRKLRVLRTYIKIGELSGLLCTKFKDSV